MHDSSQAKLWNSGFVYLLAVNLVNSSAFGMTVPLVPGYVVSLGATLSFAGAVTGVFSISALIGRPLASIIGDRFNKKRLLMLALCLNGFSVILYSLAPGLMWLMPMRVLHGLVFAISGTVSFALGTDYVPPKRLGEGVGYLGVGHIVGMAFGPNIGILLLERYSYKFCFVLAGMAILTAGLSVTALRYDYTPQESPNSGDGRTSRGRLCGRLRLSDLVAVELLPNTFFTAILAVGYGLINSYLVMLAGERNIANIGIYFIVNSSVQLAARPFLGRLVDRKGVVYVIIPGFLLVGAAMALIGLSYMLWPLLLAAVLAAAGFGALPAIQTDCVKRLHSSRRTLAMGMYFIGMDTGISAGQILGGILTDSFSFTATYNSAAFLMAAGLGLYLGYRYFLNSPIIRSYSSSVK